MELENFIETVVTEVVSATEKCSIKLKREINITTSKDNSSIDFDIAVSAENKSGGQAGIKVLGIIAGNVDDELKNSSVSRIKFSIYIDDLIKEERNKIRKSMYRPTRQ
jgi:hypothetical protein